MKPPPLGPEPTLLSRSQVDALYETLEALKDALNALEVDYIVTGGSLLGAVRQHSVLFCDDDIDIAVVGQESYLKVQRELSTVLDPQMYIYSVKPWEAGDRVRPRKCSNVFVDIFCVRSYTSWNDLVQVIGRKTNGDPQPEEYVEGILSTIRAKVQHAPFWHFDTRKAIELWPKEVYQPGELFPLRLDYKMGPVVGVSGPYLPVPLLHRAFGEDCFSVYYASPSHQQRPTGSTLRSIGTWESSAPQPLLDEHFIPMQPTAKAKRRHTMHCRQALVEYLEQEGRRPRRTIYLDGVFDLFHVGHLQAIRHCQALGDRVVLGVTGDADATGYKRKPIIPEADRAAIVGAIVDKVVCPCPLVVTEAFMLEHGIDLVVHGFANEADATRQREFFEYPMAINKFQTIPYSDGTSTTDLMEEIRRRPTTSHQWFGTTINQATRGAPTIGWDPFPLDLRICMEPFLEKARATRAKSLCKFMDEANDGCSLLFDKFRSSTLASEMSFTFDPSEYSYLQSSLTSMADLPETLEFLHTDTSAKSRLMERLCSDFESFQGEYERFVLRQCTAILAERYDGERSFYYQVFPCLRVIQPGEFSIGPHADVAYGHMPCTMNVYVPLTRIGGSSSVFMESRMGSEDWHPIQASFGTAKIFAGGVCMHWTTENTTSFTRVSLDFRMIPGSLYEGLPIPASDVYRKQEGYYAKCWQRDDGSWERIGSLAPPDPRFGFPWTSNHL